jgi:hypothetical protein
MARRCLFSSKILHQELISPPSKTGKSKHLQPIRNQENKQLFKIFRENIGEQKVKIRSQLMSTQAAFQKKRVGKRLESIV